MDWNDDDVSPVNNSPTLPTDSQLEDFNNHIARVLNQVKKKFFLVLKTTNKIHFISFEKKMKKDFIFTFRSLM